MREIEEQKKSQVKIGPKATAEAVGRNERAYSLTNSAEKTLDPMRRGRAGPKHALRNISTYTYLRNATLLELTLTPASQPNTSRDLDLDLICNSLLLAISSDDKMTRT